MRNTNQNKRPFTSVEGPVSLAPLLSVPMAAAILGVSRWTMYRWCEDGVVGSVKVGRLRKVRQEDLLRFIDENSRGRKP